MPRPKQRTPELRERILATAVEILAADGAGGLTARSVAHSAETSPSALYELFGDKAGLLRALYVEGFRMLSADLSVMRETADPIADLWALAGEYRRFIRAHRPLAEVMFSRPFTEFFPGTDDLAAVHPVLLLVAGRVRRCIEVGRLRGDETDVAHVLVAVMQGMVFAEVAGRLGPATEAVERRWRLAIGTTLNGFGGRPS